MKGSITSPSYVAVNVMLSASSIHLRSMSVRVFGTKADTEQKKRDVALLPANV